jgi:hypothetical protein
VTHHRIHHHLRGIGATPTVSGDLSDGLGLRDLYTFSPTGQGSIEVHALPTRSTLIAVLNPNLQSLWTTPSETGIVYNNAIDPRPAPFNNAVNIPLPRSRHAISTSRAYREHWFSDQHVVRKGSDIDLSIVTGTTTSKYRVYRVRA